MGLKNLCCQNRVQFVKVMDLVCSHKLNVDFPLQPSRKLILMQKIVCQMLVHGQLVQRDVSIIQRINVFTGIHIPREGKIVKMFKFVQIQHKTTSPEEHLNRPKHSDPCIHDSIKPKVKKYKKKQKIEKTKNIYEYCVNIYFANNFLL